MLTNSQFLGHNYIVTSDQKEVFKIFSSLVKAEKYVNKLGHTKLARTWKPDKFEGAPVSFREYFNKEGLRILIIEKRK